MTNLLAAATLNENLQGIITKLNELMNSFWIYIVLAMAAAVVVWGAYIGIKVAIAHRNEDKINAAINYAENLGIAFQIQDDILDIEGDFTSLGKPVGSDEKNDKSTIVKYYGLEKSKELVKEYTDKAIYALENFENTEMLENLAYMLINRTN